MELYRYTLSQWLAVFFVYCVLGWVFESTVVSVHQRRFVNRGFLAGPWIPLYGTGAVLILFVTLPVRTSPILMFLFGALSSTLLEYLTGVAMERLFGVRYWDYSDKKFNFQGQICLLSTVVWGFLTLLVTLVIQPPITQVLALIPPALLNGITLVLAVLFTFDFAYAFRTALDLKEALRKAEALKQELSQMHQRMKSYEDALSISVETAANNASARLNEHVTELNVRLSRQREQAKHRIQEEKEKVSTLTDQRMEELEGRILAAWDRLENGRPAPENEPPNLREGLQKMQRRIQAIRDSAPERQLPSRIHTLLNRNPSAKSIRFKEELQYLRTREGHKEEQ